MGYYTDYTLSVFSAKRDASGAISMSDQIPFIIEEQIDKEIGRMNIFSDGNIKDSYYAHAKWYDHEQDMRLLSARFPDMVFWLSGRGEGDEDLWQKYFLGGKMQEAYAQIVYDDFDPSKLEGDTVSADGISKQRYSYQI